MSEPTYEELKVRLSQLEDVYKRQDYRREQSELLIGDFNADTFKPSETSFLRIGAGSLGGKARGLAFVRHLLRKHRIARRFPLSLIHISAEAMRLPALNGDPTLAPTVSSWKIMFAAGPTVAMPTKRRKFLR